MTDYKEQVNSLREHADLIETSIELYGPSATRLLVYDLRNAAAAIEALNRLLDQNTQRCEALRKQLREAHESYERHLNELEAQLPKRGKWIETEEKEWGIYPFKKQTCSVCDCKIDHIFMLACMDYFDDRDTVFHYCPNCGAKMEVQDGK